MVNRGKQQWPNYFTHWPTGPVLRNTFVQYLIAFCSRLEVMSDVISGRCVRPVVPDNRVKFGDRRLNLSREIPLKPYEEAISTVFSL